MKLYLDDERPAPDGWVLIKTAEMAIRYLKKGIVSEISLDHDLGRKKTGYDVILWMEEAVARTGYIPPDIRIHTANPVGRRKMEAGIEAMRKRLEN